ncbi:AAA family ATPase [Streptomyces longispororuber]|uniref:AAA family ATPase n=1 Tax=Streptomyces longispororuber TaxID=68230 RepID=UPI0040401924
MTAPERRTRNVSVERLTDVQAAAAARSRPAVSRRPHRRAGTCFSGHRPHTGWPRLTGALVGRDREQEVLGEFVTAPEGRSLMLKGETGVGKSALLSYAADLAASRQHRVMRAAGVEAESGLQFAGLHQFLHPLLSYIDRLDSVDGRVFDVVFGRSRSAPPSVMTLGIAVLDLFALVASPRPLVLVLDDGQWLDASSIEVLGFVGRRLTGSSVKLVVGLRSDVPSGFDTSALPSLPVTTLSDPASEKLLDLHHPGLEPQIRQVVLDEAKGNPLALLELPPYLHSSRAGQDVPVPFGYTGIPLPQRLQHVYGSRIQALDTGERAVLLRGALDGVSAGTAADRTRTTRYRILDAGRAAELGLVEVDPLSGDFVFRHPLVRSAVVQLATPNERRAAHVALAEVHRKDVERHASHLGASTVDPDETVAAALEAAADSAMLRGGALAAVSWLTRAAELSETHAARSRRLGDAARPDLAGPRRLPAAGSGPDGGPCLPHARSRVLRTARHGRLGRTGASRAAGCRWHRPRNRAPPVGSDLAGTPGRRTRRERTDEQGDRRTHAPVAAHGQFAPVPRLPQAGYHLACRAARRAEQDPGKPGPVAGRRKAGGADPVAPAPVPVP